MSGEAPSIEGMMESVEVVVGSGGSRWHIHKNLLLKDSPMARALFENGFKEAASNKVTWPDFTPDGFGIFVHYLYNSRLPEKKDFISLLRAYIIGDQLSNTPFLDLIFAAIFDRYQASCLTTGPAMCFTPANVAFVMENTSQGTPLRRMCIDIVGSGLLTKTYTLSGYANGNAVINDPGYLLPAEHKADFLDGVMNAVRAGVSGSSNVKLELDRYLPHFTPTLKEMPTEVKETEE